ncbi:MAG: hypothetical protein V4724_28000 [Pseudomonadota bacterium]
MTIHHAVRYKNHFLDCEPLLLASGKYAAQVVMTFDTGHTITEREFPALAEFDTELDAIAFAKVWGRRWIDGHP